MGCLHVCVEKMKATIVTHNPEAFEMEQHHFEREEDLGSGCLYLDGIWTEMRWSALYLLLRVDGEK